MKTVLLFLILCLPGFAARAQVEFTHEEMIANVFTVAFPGTPTYKEEGRGVHSYAYTSALGTMKVVWGPNADSAQITSEAALQAWYKKMTNEIVKGATLIDTAINHIQCLETFHFSYPINSQAGVTILNTQMIAVDNKVFMIAYANDSKKDAQAVKTEMTQFLYTLKMQAWMTHAEQFLQQR